MWKRQQQERGGQTTAKTTSRQGKQARWRENEKFGYWAIRLPRAMQKILPRSCLPSHWSCLGAPRARSSSLWSSRCHGTPHLHSNVAPTFCAHPTRPRQLPSATKRHAHGGVDRIFAAFRAGDTTPHAKQTKQRGRQRSTSAQLQQWEEAWRHPTGPGCVGLFGGGGAAGGGCAGDVAAAAPGARAALLPHACRHRNVEPMRPPMSRVRRTHVTRVRPQGPQPDPNMDM